MISISTAPSPYCLKYFLAFICIFYAFLPSQTSPFMFTTYYYLFILINRKVLMICITDLLKIPFNILPLLFKFMLATSHFPTAWKIASVIPLHKFWSLHDVKYYRPISVFPSLSNVFEKFNQRTPIQLFEANNLLYNCNSGFRKYHSTTSNISEVTHKLLLAKDSGC